jgi:PAS domain S-box-containing protein
VIVIDYRPAGYSPKNCPLHFPSPKTLTDLHQRWWKPRGDGKADFDLIPALAFAAVCVIAAALIRLALGWLIGTNLTFVVFYPAVLLATLIAGTSAGLWAIALSLLTAWLAFSPPLSPGIPKIEEIANYMAFSAASLLIVWMAAAHRRLIADYERQRKKLDELLIDARRTVHERDESQAELRRTAALFESVITMTPDLVFVKDLESRALLRNPAALFGRTWDEINGKEEAAWHLSAEEAAQVVANDRKVIDAGHSMQFVEQFTTDSGIRTLLSTKSPFLDESGKIIGTIGVSTDITERENRARHVEFIMRELSHRSKNLLMIIQAVARQSIRQAATLDDFEHQFNERLASLARLHDLLVQEEWRGASLRAIAQTQIGPFAGNKADITGPEIFLKPDIAQVVSMVFHELSTNASKYGAFSNTAGRVLVGWGYVGDDQQRLFIRWQEVGGPAVITPIRKGFGSQVLERMALQIPDASASLKFPTPGVIWYLEAPTKSVLDIKDHREISADSITVHGVSLSSAGRLP